MHSIFDRSAIDVICTASRRLRSRPRRFVRISISTDIRRHCRGRCPKSCGRDTDLSSAFMTVDCRWMRLRRVLDVRTPPPAVLLLLLLFLLLPETSPLNYRSIQSGLNRRRSVRLTQSFPHDDDDTSGSLAKDERLPKARRTRSE